MLFYIPLSFSVYLLLCVFTTVVTAMLFAGVYGVRKARLLRLKWAGYGEAIGWLVIGLFEVFVLIQTLVKIWPNGMPDDFKGISLEVWTSILLWFAFTMFLAVTNYLSVRNLKRRTQAELEAFAELKNASFKLRRELRRERA